MKTYLVGGAVRDMVLNRTPSDKDYVVFGATVQEMLAAGFIQVGKQFPVFLHPVSKNEYALARKEEKNGNKHTDFRFIFTPDITPQEDVARRDFTCNALLYDEENHRLIDLVGGCEDIKNRVLRHVDSTHFIEDPLRVLRMCRFAAKLNFGIHPKTMALASQMVKNGMLNHLTAERIWNEIYKSLNEQNFTLFILSMRECGALRVVLPELEALWQTPERPDYHPEGNSGEHTVLTLQQGDNLSARAKFALLLHDVGKTLTSKELLPAHHGHGAEAKLLIQKICSRLKVPNEYRDFALMVAAQHMQIYNVSKMRKGTLLKLLTDVCKLKYRQDLADYIRICRCDLQGKMRAASQQERSCFRKSSLRLIANFKIQSKIRATDMPDFAKINKDAFFAAKLFDFRVKQIV